MLVKKKIKKISKWVSITERTVLLDHAKGPEVFHSFNLADYVSVVAVDKKGRIPLVRQYRPALDSYTIELPGGLMDINDTPEFCANRELFEETGLTPRGKVTPIACLFPDTGRLENRLWGFFAKVEKPALNNWQPEPGVEVLFVTQYKLRQMIFDGKFNHALHVALIGIAFVKGYLFLDKTTEL